MEELFLATISRPPTAEEERHVVRSAEQSQYEAGRGGRFAVGLAEQSGLYLQPVNRMRLRSDVPILDRRKFFQLGALSVTGGWLAPLGQPLRAASAEKVSPRGSAECVIFVNMVGVPRRWTRSI